MGLRGIDDANTNIHIQTFKYEEITVKRNAIAGVCALSVLAFASVAGAGQGNYGSHFIANWDADEDGTVTLEEATEKRSDIFVTFDADDDGVLTPEEYAAFDEARKADMADLKKGGQGGAGMKDPKKRPSYGMTLEFNDVDGDGNVSRDEFLDRTPDWFAMLDRNGDGLVTAEDFGPPRN